MLRGPGSRRVPEKPSRAVVRGRESEVGTPDVARGDDAGCGGCQDDVQSSGSSDGPPVVGCCRHRRGERDFGGAVSGRKGAGCIRRTEAGEEVGSSRPRRDRRRDYPRRSGGLCPAPLGDRHSRDGSLTNNRQKTIRCGDLASRWISSRVDMAISGCAIAETGFMVGSVWVGVRSRGLAVGYKD